ncbi:MAG: ketopantoate reductase family protein, partial [Salinibacterium sp.]|nr:ketopantoate reductase family protein [Salinibacterium sp.]
QEVVAHGGLRRVMTASMREAVRVAAASGIRFAPLQGLNDALLRGFARLPLWAGQALPSVMSARIGSVPNPGSTLQSIRRGQLTEIDYLNGAVVRAAEAIGAVAPVAESIGAVAPVNAALVGLVHEVERSGEFLRPSEVVARVAATVAKLAATTVAARVAASVAARAAAS